MRLEFDSVREVLKFVKENNLLKNSESIDEDYISKLQDFITRKIDDTVFDFEDRLNKGMIYHKDNLLDNIREEFSGSRVKYSKEVNDKMNELFNVNDKKHHLEAYKKLSEYQAEEIKRLITIINTYKIVDTNNKVFEDEDKELEEYMKKI